MKLCDKPGPQCKYWELYNNISCLFVEGVEFLTKTEIYDAIKREWNNGDIRLSSYEKLSSSLVRWASVNLEKDANHLGKLREELEELEDKPGDPMEMADVLLALILHADKHNVDLLDVAMEKLEVVKGRKYGKPNSDGVARHI